MKNDLGDLEIFGENVYAVHSIEYRKLDHHYYVFGVRQGDTWLGWDEVKFYADLFDFPTVSELSVVRPVDEVTFRQEVMAMVSENSIFDSYDVASKAPCAREGVVSRNANAFAVDEFAHHVFKYVRKGHVKTDEHWTRRWKRARLKGEFPV